MKEKAGQVQGQRVAGQGEQQALCCEMRQSLQQLGSRQELWLEWRLPGDQPWRALRNPDFILNQGLGHQRILSRGGTCSGFFFKRSLWLPAGDRLVKWARIEPGEQCGTLEMSVAPTRLMAVEALRRGQAWGICFIRSRQDFLMERMCRLREGKEPRITLRWWDWVLVGCRAISRFGSAGRGGWNRGISLLGSALS